MVSRESGRSSQVMRRASCVALIASIVLLAGCGSEEGGDCDPIAAALVERIEVSPPSPTVTPGQTLPLSATAFSCAGPLGSVAFTWESQNTAIATVSATGVVSGIATGGPVQVIARAQGKQGAASVTVGQVRVSSVTVTPSPTVVGVARTAQLTVHAFDAEGDEVTGRAATWSSANEAIASVNASGLVTGVAAGGPVAITATVDGVSGSSQVTVSAVPVATVTVAPPSSTIGSGTTVQLAATLRDAQGNVLAGRTVTWSSANDQVAQVSATGLVMGLRIGGPVVITAASESQSGTAQVTVTVGAAARLAFTQQPTNVVAGAAIAPTIVVEAQDAGGNRVTTFNGLVTLALEANPGGATLSGTVTTGAVNGRATFSNITLNRTGTGYTIIAAASGLTSVTSASFNVTPGAANRLAFITQPSNVAAGVAMSPAVQVEVRDAFDNPVTIGTGSTAPVTVALANNPGDAGTLGGTRTVNAVAGVATFGTLTLDRVAVGYTLAASSGVLTGATSAAFNVTPGAARRLVFLNTPVDLAAGETIQPAIQVQAQDEFGNAATAFTGLVQLVLQGGPVDAVLSGTTEVNAAGGVATFSGLSINRAATNYTLTASSGVLEQGVSAVFSVAAGSATGLGFVVQPSNIEEGDTFSPQVQVQVQDAFGNRITTVGATLVTITVRSSTDGNPPNPATLGGDGTQNTVAGLASFPGLTVNLSSNSTQTLRLRASAGSGLGNVASATFMVRAD